MKDKEEAGKREESAKTAEKKPIISDRLRGKMPPVLPPRGKGTTSSSTTVDLGPYASGEVELTEWKKKKRRKVQDPEDPAAEISQVEYSESNAEPMIVELPERTTSSSSASSAASSSSSFAYVDAADADSMPPNNVAEASASIVKVNTMCPTEMEPLEIERKVSSTSSSAASSFEMVDVPQGADSEPKAFPFLKNGGALYTQQKKPSSSKESSEQSSEEGKSEQVVEAVDIPGTEEDSGEVVDLPPPTKDKDDKEDDTKI